MCRAYKCRVLLDEVCFRAPEGRVTALVGANGSGKSTLLNVIAGILRPDAGSVKIAGIDIEDDWSDLEVQFQNMNKNSVLNPWFQIELR